MFRPKRLWNFTRVVGEDKTLTNKERRAIIGRKGSHVDFMASNSDLLSLYEYRKAVYIVIGGSNDLIDWIKNLFWLIAGKLGSALGFTVPAYRFYDDLMRWHSDIIKTKQIIIVGHSRGGAIGVILGYLLARFNPKVRTFGAPRPGGRRFKKKCEEVGLDVVNYQIEDDPVCKIPPIRGKHVGEIVKLPANGGSPKKNHKAYGNYFD